MPIKLLREKVLSFSQAARRLPRLRRNRPVNPSTVYRWSENGINGVRLESAMLGGRRVTSVEALERFFARLNEIVVPPPPATSNQDERHEVVECELASRGI